MWPYQQERQRIVKHEWDRDHLEHNRVYRQGYREDHPEETQQQRLKDWRSFYERNPERWREIHRAALKRYCAKQKLLRQAERELIAQEGKVKD